MNPKESRDYSASAEFEWGKRKIQTLVESGALAFLENLHQSILLDPELSAPVRILVGDIFYDYARGLKSYTVEGYIRTDKSLYIKDVDVAFQALKGEKNGALYGFKILPDKHKSYAVVDTWYNPRANSFPLRDRHLPLPLSIARGPIGKHQYVLFDILQVQCFEPGQLVLQSCYSQQQYGIVSRVMVEREWRKSGTVDNVLGELYAKRPAISYRKRPIGIIDDFF